MSYRYRNSYGRYSRRRNTFRRRRQLFDEIETFSYSSVEDTYTEEEVVMPTPRSANQIPVIHCFEVVVPSMGADADEIDVILSLDSHATQPHLDDNEVISEIYPEFQIVTSGGGRVNRVMKDELRVPRLAPVNTLIVGSTVNMGGNKTIYGRIHYTMRYVTKAEIMEALMD